MKKLVTDKLNILSRYHFIILAAAFFYASFAVFSGLLAQEQVSPVTQILWRGIFGAMAALVGHWILSSNKRIKVTWYELWHILVNAALVIGGSVTFIGSIYLGTPVAMASLLSYAYPLSVILLSYFWLQETVTRKSLVAICLSLASIFVLFQGWQIESLSSIRPSDLFALASSVFFGAVIVWGGKMRRDTELSPLLNLFYTMMFTVGYILILGWAFGYFGVEFLSLDQITLPVGQAWWWLMGLGVFGAVVPLALLYIGIKHVSSIVSSVLLATEPVWVYLFGLILFGQILSASFWIALVGIILSVIFV